jgi:membrane protein
MRKPIFIKPITGFLLRLWREFNTDQCPVRASGLAFASLLALVPISALLFSLFSGFGAFSSIVESIQAFLIRILVPTQQEEILTYISRFVENTSGLGVFGLVFFLITSVFLLAGIQRTFDVVWGTVSKRNAARKFATYISILIVGSFLLSIGLNITGVLSSSFAKILPAETGWLPKAFIRAFPTIFLFAAMFFMIRLIPAARVASLSALVGAVVGTVLWEIARAIFVFWANYVIKLSVIYGSLAVVPIFLIWLYLAWTIVLLSLEVAYVHQHRDKRSISATTWAHEPAEMLRSGLELYLLIAREFVAGAKPPSSDYLADHLGLTERDVSHLVDKFQNANLLIPAGEKGRGYVPSRELSAIPAEEIARCVFGALSIDSGSRAAPGQLYDVMVRGAINSIRDSSIKDLIDSDGVVPPEPNSTTAHPKKDTPRRTATGQAKLKTFWRFFRK